MTFFYQIGGQPHPFQIYGRVPVHTLLTISYSWLKVDSPIESGRPPLRFQVTLLLQYFVWGSIKPIMILCFQRSLQGNLRHQSRPAKGFTYSDIEFGQRRKSLVWKGMRMEGKQSFDIAITLSRYLRPLRVWGKWHTPCVIAKDTINELVVRFWFGLQPSTPVT